MSAMQKHLDAIASGTVTKTNVIGIRKAINHIERLNAGWSGNRSAATVDEVFAVEQALAEQRPRVGGELHDTGVKLLQSPRYRKRWQPWQSEAIAAIDHFRLVAYDRIGSRGQYSVPVYAVWAKIPPKGDALDGGSYEAFRFRNIPWQSGGDGPEVVSADA